MRTENIQGRTAVVTGGSSGIGRSTSLVLAAAGVRVGVLARNPEKTAAVVDEILSAGGEACALICDIADPESVEAAFAQIQERWGAVDILISNAGMSRGKGLASTTPAEWQAMMDTNVNGGFYASHYAYEQMREKKGGHIIHMSSQAANWPGAGECIYGTTKTAQLKLGLHTIDEFFYANKSNERDENSYFCDIICPGCVDTPWYEGKNVDGQEMINPDHLAALICDILIYPEADRSFHEENSVRRTYSVLPLTGLFAELPRVHWIPVRTNE